MKPGIVTMLAALAFKTAPTGQRVFYCGFDSFRSRPYLLPDSETERRLFQKQVWLTRWCFGPLMLIQWVLLAILLRVAGGFEKFFLYSLILLLIAGTVNWLVFRRDLAPLNRTDAPLPISVFLADSAQHYSWLLLFLGLGIQVAAAIGVIYLIIREPTALVGWVGLVLVSLGVLAWVYMIRRKRTPSGTKPG